MENKDKLNIFREHCTEWEADIIYRCLWDMDYQDHFPEDMIEDRTDWGELRDRLSNAHYAVDYLIDIIDRLINNKPKESEEE